MGNVKWRLKVLKFKPACIYFTLMYETKLRQLAMITHMALNLKVLRTCKFDRLQPCGIAFMLINSCGGKKKRDGKCF